VIDDRPQAAAALQKKISLYCVCDIAQSGGIVSAQQLAIIILSAAIWLSPEIN